MSDSAANKGADQTAATVFSIIATVSVCHFLNDMLQSLLPAIYPILKDNYGLDFGQIGLVTFTFQFTASLLQPFVGAYTDRRPLPFSLPVGMAFTFLGLIVLSRAGSFPGLLMGAALVGTGSAVLHPEASRVARMASGGRHGLAQSLFQVGGNVGSSIGPLLAAFVVLRFGQSSVAWFAIAALVAMFLLIFVGRWYGRHGLERQRQHARHAAAEAVPSRSHVGWVIAVLIMLVFSKMLYMASMTSYYTFYLIEKFGVSIRVSQILLFVFLGSVALGTVCGGALGDRFGRKIVIWVSILGVLPFTLLLPHTDLAWTIALSVPIGFVLASAFPAIVVYGQELMPSRSALLPSEPLPSGSLQIGWVFSRCFSSAPSCRLSGCWPACCRGRGAQFRSRLCLRDVPDWPKRPERRDGSRQRSGLLLSQRLPALRLLSRQLAAPTRVR
jgi:FSR family fosmidomycin resistance protein-like MFS transporter